MTLPLTDHGSSHGRSTTPAPPAQRAFRHSGWLLGILLTLLGAAGLLYHTMGTQTAAPAYRTGPGTRGAVTAS
ncbi:hypothetical protein, partial [Azospirillum sp. TSO5]|uniref:hypothetical protein n=1 Tax=Azospirillum sp. TSO5 TaxID=716760 RepID=UPI000D616B24